MVLLDSAINCMRHCLNPVVIVVHQTKLLSIMDNRFFFLHTSNSV